MDCANIATNIVAAVCNYQVKAGTEEDFIILNYADIDRSLSSADDDMVTELVLKSTKKGVSFTSLEDASLGEFSLVKGTFMDRWQHDVTGRIFTKDEAAKAFMNGLGRKARIVIILKNKEEGFSVQNTGTMPGATKYEVYGWDSGLELLEATGTTTVENGVVYQFKAGSSETAKEGSIPKSFFDGVGLTSTEAALASLLAP